MLEELILNDKVSVSCSDDFHWNSMTVEGKPNRFFHLEYSGESVILYEIIGERNKGQKLNLNSLDKQVLFK